MNRRNALLGLGAIATGGGALFGSGAFSQVEAQRAVSVEVEGDSAAFLQLAQASANTGYVQNNGGTLDVYLNENGASSGQGLNYDAVTYVEPLFDIRNEGSETVSVRISNSTQATGPTSASVDGKTVTGFTNSGAGVVFYASTSGGTESGDSNFGTGVNLTTSNSIVGDTGTPPDNSLDLAVGGSVEVAFAIDTTGVTTGDVPAGTDLIGDITIQAGTTF